MRSTFLRNRGWRAAAILTVLLVTSSAKAQVTPEHRRELTGLRAEVGRVPSLLRAKKFDEAEAALDAAESRLQQIASDAGVEPNDRRMLGVSTLIERQRDALAKQRRRAGQPPADAVSFSRDVAPIIADACLGCHGAENPRANLRLDTFRGWKRGGRSGPLLVIGKADSSLLIRALRAPDPKRRMPKDADPLDDKQLQTIAEWINQGARYDGKSDEQQLTDLAEAAIDPNVVIPKPKGTETISFTRDIAPFMANLCGGCHSRQRKSGGLCLETFYDMMKGGDSGTVVIPGDLEGSRLFRLVGGLENPRMPQGQARITRKNYEDLKQWFREGCVYDGEDPKTPLREFVRSPEEIEAEKFAAMSEAEVATWRVEQAQQHFRRALPNDTLATLETDEFYLVGNVTVERLREVQQWAEAHVERLNAMFGAAQGRLWKGRLALYVLKDRFSYDEFNLVIERREATRDMTGHSVVTPSLQDAYVVLLDVGDTSSEESSSLRVNLMDHLTAAYLKRDAALPDWVVRGLGLALAAQAHPDDAYLRRMPRLAREDVAALSRPEDVFAPGTFSPGALGPVAYTLVDFMLDEAGHGRFVEFVAALRSGQDVSTALRAVYRSDLSSLARGYLRSLD